LCAFAINEDGDDKLSPPFSKILDPPLNCTTDTDRKNFRGKYTTRCNPIIQTTKLKKHEKLLWFSLTNYNTQPANKVGSFVDRKPMQTDAPHSID